MDQQGIAPHLLLHPSQTVPHPLHPHYLVQSDPALGRQVSQGDQYAIAPMPTTAAKGNYRSYKHIIVEGCI